jgi:hypothetical protein
MNARPRDCVVVASEKADFIADRIAAGLPAPEAELRKLARYLREIAAEMDRPRSARGVFRDGGPAADPAADPPR